MFLIRRSPNGWYVVSTSDELKARDQKSLRYFGRDLVLYRDNNNQARLVDAFTVRIWPILAMERSSRTSSSAHFMASLLMARVGAQEHLIQQSAHRNEQSSLPIPFVSKMV